MKEDKINKIVREETDPKTGEKKIILDEDLLRREMDKGELFFIEDSKRGVRVELHSRILDITQLTSLGTGVFDWLEKQNKSSKDKSNSSMYG